MKPQIFNFFLYIIIILFISNFSISDDKIQSVPLVNLEDLSPTFEEDKFELEKIDENNISKEKKLTNSSETTLDDKVYINVTTLDKITAKTSSIRLTLGEKKYFGPLEIKALKCQLSENNNSIDTVAYLQVKDLSKNDNDQVFLFNGWTFASSPTLQSIDHPVYDLWITSCDNI